MGKILVIGLCLGMLFSCSKKAPLVDTTSRTIDKESVEILRSVIIEAFWSAADTSMRENMNIPQGSKLEQFKKEHVAKIHSLEPKQGESNIHRLILRITIPELTGAFYEITFDSEGREWRSVDARTKVKTNEFNYFSGKFLGKKSLKPYLDKELKRLNAPILE